MTDLIDTYRPLPPLSPADKIYIRSNFHTLEELCLSRPNKPADYRSQIRAGLLPLPTYAVEGVEMYPSDYFVFPDSVGNLGDQLKKRFFAQYRRMADSYGQRIPEERIGEEFASYLSGEYGVCLRWVTPETIFLKGLAMGKIDELLSEPKAGDSTWSVTLRSWTSRLDAMEREFAPCDTARFGSLPSRVRYIDNVRAKYPDCFTAPCYPEGISPDVPAGWTCMNSRAIVLRK